jgi:hypothetical protein
MRMTPTRCIVITALCLLWPTLSHAQRVPTPADVRGRLHSTNPAEVAWAAFDAATFQMREVAPDLIAVLELPPAADTRTRDYLVAAVLDALIQAGTSIPVPGPAVAFPETLERYYSRWPVQTLILFGRERDERGPILQRLLTSASGQEWFALANLLSSQAPVPGFAATLLRGVRVTLEIVVVDPGVGAGIGSGGGGGGDGGITLDRGPTGFPPHAVYAFESGDNVGAIVLSRGPRTVYYSRRIGMRWPSGREGPTTEDRLAYLNVLLRATDYSFGSRLRPRTSVSIAWTNEPALRDSIATEQKKISDEYERMLQALMDLGYLTAEEANSLPLALDTEIHDQRSNPMQPLSNYQSPTLR